MPSAPLPYCATPGCRERAHGHCSAHRRTRDVARGSRHERGYTNAWARYSQQRLAEYPWCVGYPVGIHPLLVVAEVTDHILSARTHPELFAEPTNHQSLCDDCNKRKAIVEEGGLGR